MSTEPPTGEQGPAARGGAPGTGDLEADDIWTPRDPGPSRPPRRGPSRPPGRGAGRAGPRPLDPGAVRAEPTSGQVAAVRAREPDDHHDYVDLPHGGSLPKWLAVLAAFALVVALVVGGAWFWYERQVDPPGSPGETVTVEIPEGSSTSGIASILEDEGIIANAMVFNFYAGRKDAGPFQAGSFELRTNSDMDSVIEVLQRGPVAGPAADAVRVTVPEGLTVDEIVARIADQVPHLEVADLQAALDEGEVASAFRPEGGSYEGLLFPATYEVEGDTAAVELLGDLAAEMEGRVGRLDVDGARARIQQRWGVDLTTYELLTVASMIQAEAGNAEEAPRIATVIYNRLQEGMALGIDAVDNYGAELAGTPVDYEDSDAPYNTRRRSGLPPTPIAAPGEFALEAALQPADGPWLYYVLESPNVHTFVTTEAEFLAAKRVCEERDLGCG